MTDPADEMTTEQALAAVQEHIDERAANGVVIAQAVCDLQLDDEVLTATLDPEGSAGAQTEVTLATSAFGNLAHFVGLPLSWNTPSAAGLRRRIRRVDVRHRDGTDLGTSTAVELYRRGTGF